MKKSLNSILLSKTASVFVPESTSDKNTKKKHISAFLIDISQFGFTFSKDVILSLRNLSKNEVKALHSEVVENLKEMVGANVRYKALYPSFPDGIPDNDLFLNSGNKEFISFLEYLGFNFDISMDELFIEKERPALAEVPDFKTIKLATTETVETFFKNLLASKAVLSVSDKEAVEFLVSYFGDRSVNFLPETFDIKENLAFIAPLFFSLNENNIERLKPYFVTATDVLRLAVSLSGGDVSLKQATHFISFKNKQRKLLLTLLNNVKNPEEDMVRHASKWIRLGERLHPGSYAKLTTANRAFKTLRNDIRSIETFNKRMKNAMKANQYDVLFSILKERPGEFIRNLDFMLRKSTGEVKTSVLSVLPELAEKVNIKLLLQVKKHFENRRKAVSLRYFSPKGNIAKIKVMEDVSTYGFISKKDVDSVVEILETAIVKQLAVRENLGNVFIDEKLKGFLVPTSQRAANASLRNLVRGSQVDFDTDATIRMFLWWVENSSSGRVDVDLSAVAFDEDWKYQGHLSYTNSRMGNSVHSGDFTSAPAPHGASEFIDIDVQSFVNSGVRYVVMNLYSFSGQQFSQFESFAGFMKRKQPERGGEFEPKTVVDKFSVSGEGQYAIPVVFDLVAGKAIWTDISVSSAINYQNVESTRGNMTLMGKAIVDYINTKPNLYELFELHAKARASSINKELEEGETYDIIFSVEEGITPFMLDEIMANWL